MLNWNTVIQFFLAILATIMQITPARKWKVPEDRVDYHAKISYRLKKET